MSTSVDRPCWPARRRRRRCGRAAGCASRRWLSAWAPTERIRPDPHRACLGERCQCASDLDRQVALGQCVASPRPRLLEQHPEPGVRRGAGQRLTRCCARMRRAGEQSPAARPHRRRSADVARSPLPSRRPSAAGRSIGTPAPAQAIGVAGPAHARIRVSSPLRKRWQRTPPVPRPLAGYSANGGDLDAPASVPGSAAELPDTVTTAAAAPGGHDAEEDDLRVGAEPDAGHAAGRSALRADGGRGEAQQLAVGGDEHQVVVVGDRAAAPTTSSSSLRPMTSQRSLFVERLDGDPLDDAVAGAERHGRPSRRARPAPAPARRVPRSTNSRTGAPPARVGPAAVFGSVGRSSTREPDDLARWTSAARPRRAPWS